MKKSFFLLVIFVSAAHAAELLPVKIGGFIDTYYAYDFNAPKNHEREFTTQPVRHNEFNINMAYIDATVKNENTRGRLALHQGNSDRPGVFLPSDKEWAALQWAFLNRQTAGRFTDTLPAVKGHYIPLMDQTGIWGMIGIDTSPLKELSTESLALIQAISQQLSFALGRDDLFRQLQTRQVREESEKIYKTLLNSVSHELRTPLTAIHGFADALINRGNNEVQVSEFAREISLNAGRLEQVVKNFLDMGRIEAGQLKLLKSETDLEELVRGVWNQLKSYLKNRQVQFHFPPNPVILPLDSVLIAQAIENVLKNALTYTPHDAIIDVQLLVDGRQARLTISDNGPGLGSDPQQVFEKFWRGNPGKTGGTGLGLSIAHAFVELHHGTLTAENVRSGGALFRFTLPFKEQL